METAVLQHDTQVGDGKVIIYGLADPRDGQLRYVGKTNDLQRRYRKHTNTYELRRERSHKNSWILGLLAAGLKPEAFEIEQVSVLEWREAERFWIGYFRSIGCRLTNVHEGGWGLDSSPTEETKAKLRGRLVRWHRSPEALARRAQRPLMDDERRAAVSKRAKAMWANPTQRTRLVHAMRGPRIAKESRNCPHCGNTFEAYPKSNQTFCSRSCASSAILHKRWSDPSRRHQLPKGGGRPLSYLADCPELPRALRKRLHNAGVRSREQLRLMPDESLLSIRGMGVGKLRAIREALDGL